MTQRYRHIFERTAEGVGQQNLLLITLIASFVLILAGTALVLVRDDAIGTSDALGDRVASGGAASSPAQQGAQVVRRSDTLSLGGRSRSVVAGLASEPVRIVTSAQTAARLPPSVQIRPVSRLAAPRRQPARDLDRVLTVPAD